ncbi:MAG: neutral zinc metallopeptidase, partial [Dokdonella sp.]
MRWDRSRRSSNVEQSSGRGGGGMRFGGGSLGIGGIILVVVVGLLFGKNPGEILQLLGNMAGGGGTTTSAPQTTEVADNEQTDFVKAVLGSTEDTWGELFQAGGQQYPAPHLILFNGGVSSACGAASSAMGPFYCPGDQQVYLDLDFFREMETKFRAAGEFARAYVIAHEVGHHV